MKNVFAACIKEKASLAAPAALRALLRLRLCGGLFLQSINYYNSVVFGEFNLW